MASIFSPSPASMTCIDRFLAGRARATTRAVGSCVCGNCWRRVRQALTKPRTEQNKTEKKTLSLSVANALFKHGRATVLLRMNTAGMTGSALVVSITWQYTSISSRLCTERGTINSHTPRDVHTVCVYDEFQNNIKKNHHQV